MTKLSFAPADSLLAWLKKMAASHRLVAPRQEGPSVVFRAQKADDLKDLPSLLKRGTASPKEVILPKSEVLVRFSATKKEDDPGSLDMTLQAPGGADTSGETILFGCRPCDARGFVVLDRPYLQGKYVDPYYKARRDATLIITQACPSSYTGCFCNWVGSNPADAEGSDILFTAVEGGFVLEGISEKGQALLDGAGFDQADDKRGQIDAAHQAAAETLPPASVLENIPGKVAAMFTNEDFWTRETVKCLSCGACTYLCPTCQCFNITDEGTALDGKRVRSWDSCMTSQFTLEASGHNTRPEKGRRMRQRIGHKFSYYPQTYEGQYSCCGCGRCVVSCPACLDIRQVVAHAVFEAPEVAAKPAAPSSVAAPAPAPKAEAAPKPAPEAQKPSGKSSSSKKSGKSGKK